MRIVITNCSYLVGDKRGGTRIRSGQNITTYVSADFFAQDMYKWLRNAKKYSEVSIHGYQLSHTSSVHIWDRKERTSYKQQQ